MHGKGYCVVCGKPFGPSERSDKLTCSDVCRSRRSRFKKRIANQITTALDAIYDVATITQGEQFTDMAFSELDYLVDYAKAVHADLTMHQSPRKWWEAPVNLVEYIETKIRIREKYTKMLEDSWANLQTYDPADKAKAVQQITDALQDALDDVDLYYHEGQHRRS